MGFLLLMVWIAILIINPWVALWVAFGLAILYGAASIRW